MMKNNKESIARNNKSLSPFGQKLQEALKHYRNPQWLGENSPLAAPYLLHEHLKSSEVDAKLCGEALRAVLREAVDQIQGGPDDRLHKAILKELFFHGRTVAAALMQPDIDIERTQLYEHRRYALMSLEAVVINSLKPALRLESPIQVRGRLLGREKAIPACEKRLKACESVLITGSGGVGKTTFANHLATKWLPDRVFWFTVRTGVNDHISSLLFSLGYFLHRCHESVLWQTLLAEGDKIDLEKALAITRHALQSLKQRGETPLLCFDEVDLLAPEEYAEHGQFLHLVNGLRTRAAILVVGQQAPLFDVADVYELKGLSISETIQLLESSDVLLRTDEQKQLHTHTQGNPRLLELFINLYTDDEHSPSGSKALDTVLQALASTHPLAYLLSRILQRLSELERSIVIELAVYRGLAPSDIWRTGEAASALLSLIKRRLVQTDRRGGVALLPAYRVCIDQSLPSDKRRNLHLQAAATWQVRGAFTASVYHLVQAGQVERAIFEWAKFSQEEINQGQGGAARQLFREIKTMHLPLRQEAQETLAHQCATLERLRGNLTGALDDLHSILWQTPIRKIQADALEAKIANDLSQLEKAEALYRESERAARQMVGAQLATIHKGVGWIYMREREVDAAWREAQLARYEAENILGAVLEFRCDYLAAEKAYHSALAIAKEISHQESVAKTCINLSGLYTRRGCFPHALTYLQQADGCLQAIGSDMYYFSTRINWAFTHNLAGEHQAAVQRLHEALHHFTQAGLPVPPWQQALIDQGLAEAHLGLGDLDTAEEHVRHVIEQEETDVLPDAFRTLGEISLRRNDLQAAETALQAALTLLKQNPDPYLEGYTWRALAQLYLAQQDQAKADAAQAKAIAYFEAIQLPNEVRKTLTILAGGVFIPDPADCLQITSDTGEGQT